MTPGEFSDKITSAQQSTGDFAQMLEEKATAADVLGDIGGPIMLTAENCRDLAALLRAHAQMAGDLQQMLAYETARADMSQAQLQRALSLVEQSVALWRKNLPARAAGAGG